MGAERWLKFSSKAEANRLRSYLGADWIKDYTFEWSHTYRVDHRMWEQHGEGEYDDSRWRDMEAFIVAEFTRLDESFQAWEAASA